MKLVAPLALLAASASAYVLPAAPAAVARRTGTPHALLLPDLPPLDHLPLNLIAEIVDADGERAYGAVDAPGWVAPVGGIAVILTALLPVLLAPGDEAFRRQQSDEEKVKSQFGRDRKR